MGSKTNRSLQVKFVRSRKAAAEFMFDAGLSESMNRQFNREARDVAYARAMERYQARQEQRARLWAHFA